MTEGRNCLWCAHCVGLRFDVFAPLDAVVLCRLRPGAPRDHALPCPQFVPCDPETDIVERLVRLRDVG